MAIHTNLCALSIQGILEVQSGALRKQLRKLSSGEKIGSAGDGASEYAISEKLRAQIRSLEQTKANLTQGTNVTRAASGGLDGIYDILSTIKERALNSANDTNTDDDRKIMQQEVDQLLGQIDELAYGTEINGVKPLCMSASQVAKAQGGYATQLANIQVTTNGGYEIYAKDDPARHIGSMRFFGTRLRLTDSTGNKTLLNLNYSSASGVHATYDSAAQAYKYKDASRGIDITVKQTYALVQEDDGERGGSYYNISYEIINNGTNPLQFDAMIPMDPLAGDMRDNPTVSGAGQLSNNTRYDGADLTTGKYGTMICNPTTFPELNCDVTAILTGEHIVNQPDVLVYGGNPTLSSGADNSPNVDWAVIDGTAPVPSNSVVNYHCTSAWLDKTVDAGSSYTINMLYGISYPLEYVSGTNRHADQLWIQSGTRSNSGFYVPLCNATVDNLGLSRLDISTREHASAALSSRDKVGVIDNALHMVNDFNARFGAYHSRMEMTVDIRMQQVADETASLSTIRDANMAREMVGYTKSNILLQAAQTMLAQANQTAGNVLQLLQ